MRLRYVALIVALIIIVNAGVTYGIAQWASPSGARGPQGEQGVQGIPGPIATEDVNTALCAATIQGGAVAAGLTQYKALIAKYCP